MTGNEGKNPETAAATGVGGAVRAPPSSSEIEKDIEETLRHLEGSLEEIGDRLSPKGLVEKGRHFIFSPAGKVPLGLGTAVLARRRPWLGAALAAGCIYYFGRKSLETAVHAREIP